MNRPVLQEASPHGHADAVVLDDGRAVYLYLRFHREVEHPLRAAWVRNRIPAPATADVEAMREGLPPLMPIARCRHPGPQPALLADELRFVWLPEGDGVALYEADSLLAAVVPWSGRAGFDGFSRDAVGEGALAWELASGDPLHDRFAHAQAYWDRWATDETMWPAVREPLLASYEQAFGDHTHYFAFDGGQWPPNAVAWLRDGSRTVLVTLGGCVRPQPALDLQPKASCDPRRIELGTMIASARGEGAASDASAILSALAGYPWEYARSLGHGQTLGCELWTDGHHPAVLLADSARWGPRVELPPCHGDRVSLLWVVPLTAEQWQQAKVEGTERLLAKIESVWRDP